MTNQNFIPPANGETHFNWQADESLRRAGELLEKIPDLRAVTFDFFDTLVWRLAAKPTDVFVDVGQRLRQANLLPAHISNQDYEVLRRQSEMKARTNQALLDKSREDITLNEIFQPLKTIVPGTEAAAEIELAAEGDFCLLNPQMIEFARHAKARGLKVLIISDIYFSADQLRAILRANHFDPEFFDGIYTSADAGICKWSGKLFSQVLKKTGLKPAEILHLGDNFQSDVGGARKAGVRGCHYVQGSNETNTILEREKFLLGGQSPTGSVNSLRLLAARNFSGNADEDFFGRAGALLLGPLLTRYASWACEQFAAAGIRQVGAFMREGELLGQLLQREAAAMGHALEISPLYANRKSTDLAAIGRLTAENVIDWVSRRQTLSVKTILEQFGIRASELRHLPFSPDEKISSHERLLQFAKILFAPEIAARIEERSAAERRKVMDYLRPWLEAGDRFGVCDIGYNATAQMQLQRIFELEGCRTTMTGCYLVTCETAARRMLDGLDVRHFLGAFGNPGFNNYAFLRSPAFIEQSLVAGCGTTLGYERAADGAVRPVLGEMHFSPELLRRQRAFKDGVLHYQKLWLHFRAQKPGLLDGTTDFSRRLLADVDRGTAPILARAAAFPTQSELTHFGSLPLDDQYFAGGVKTICGAKEHELIRAKGYDSVLGNQGVLWPQAANLRLNPKSAGDFFNYARAMLLCQTDRDNHGVQPALTVLLRAGDPEKLRATLDGLVKNSRAAAGSEIVVLLKETDKSCARLAAEFDGGLHRIKVITRTPAQDIWQQLNHAADHADAPLLLLLDDSASPAVAWDQAALAPFLADTGAALATPDASCLVLRRLALVEALGFASENLSSAGHHWRLLLALHELGWQIRAGRNIVGKDAPKNLPAEDGKILARRFPNFEKTVAEVAAQFSDDGHAPVAVDWIGSFLDHGSLSHVNRELTGALTDIPEIKIQRVGNGAPAAPGFEKLAHEISVVASASAAVTVRHAWPPNWQRPAGGKLAVIQPWEFGSLPEDWVRRARDVDEFWLPSEYVRQIYIASGVPAQKVLVVPNGVDAEKFHPQVASMKLATQKKFKFLFVGGTIGRKGPDLLLQAYLKNFTAADDVCLVIKDFGGQSVYSGQTFEVQIRAAQAIPNAPEILYLNEELPPETLPGLYAACNCFVLPYRGEGFGLPVLEAMACGLPVVVTAGGATDDFVRDEFAWRIPAAKKVFGHEAGGMKLVHPGWLLEPDLAALGKQLRQIFENPAEAHKRGQLASRHAHQNFSWKNSAAIVRQRIAKLMETENAPAKSPRSVSELPKVALLGRLDEARELFARKEFQAAWESTRTAMAKRPFHPEALFLLAEIALAAGNGKVAKLCAQRARDLAPGWQMPKQFLAKPLKGETKLDWLDASRLAPHAASLSLCLIVKNEEKFLAQCLKSVRGLAAQIIVVDTGSTDRTVEIAREFGAEIYSFAWGDDFAAARNAALEHATGDWILVLDADEELPAAQHAALLTDLKKSDALAHRLPLVNVGQHDGRSFVPRLFRNAPGVYYFGRVHEQVFPSLLPHCKNWGLKTALGTAEILHHGYTKDMVHDRNKIERNLKLLRLAIEENPADVNLVMNLGLELVRSDDLAGGVEKYREAFQMMSAQPASERVPELREVLLTQFTSQLYKIRAHAEVVEILNSPLAKSGGLTASLHFALGLAQFELKQFSEAADQMRQCLAKRQSPALSPINTDIHTAAPQHCLALSLAKLDDHAGAEKTFLAALAEPGDGEKVRLDFARFLAAQNRLVEALQQLHEIVAHNPRQAAAWRLGGEITLGEPELIEFAAEWTDEAVRALPDDFILTAQRAEALLLNGDTAAALTLWEKIWHGDRSPRTLAALILCEAVESPTTHAPDEGADEQAASGAFIAWYQKLIARRSSALTARINEQLDKLARALPTAAQMLETALQESELPAEA